ncbi:MAG: cytochrome c [Deltaproteobacteria bacterium]|nr:cytochrome c [Deltaproteobacteria bacterium]
MTSQRERRGRDTAVVGLLCAIALLCAAVLFLPGCGGGVGPGGLGSSGGLGDGGSNCGADTWNSFAQGFFATNCGGCHGFASSKSGVNGQAGAIRSRIDSGSMPPGGGVSSADIDRIDNWMDCGAP